MNLVLNLICVLAAIVLISFGVNHLSQPSDLKVWIGVGEIILALSVLYLPIKRIFKL